jgi:hypothetical protein
LHSLTLQDGQDEIEKGVRNCENTVKENQEKIQADLALRDDGGERARNEARLQVLEASLNEWALKEHDAHQDVQNAENDAKAKENQEKDAKRACDTARSNVTALNNTHSQLKDTSQSAMKAYHDRMPSVLEEIQKRRGVFQQMPIGPLGAFVKIKKEQWSQICENVFGRALNGFLVSNYPDLERLREILKAKNWYPQQDYDLTNGSDVPVFVSKRDMFDYSSGEPDAQYDTVLRILEVVLYLICCLMGRSRTRMSNVNLSFRTTLSLQSSSSHVKKPIALCTAVVQPKSLAATLSTPKVAKALAVPVATKLAERTCPHHNLNLTSKVVVEVESLLSGHGRAQLD